MDSSRALPLLRKFFYKNRRLPSYQEMCVLFGFSSKKACFDLAKKLIAGGFIEKDESGKLIPKQLIPKLPVLGSIAAGFPRDAQEQFLDTLSIEQYLVGKPENSYVLRVSGDSMIEAGIYPGDLVIIEKDKPAREGDIVVAQIDNEYTLKYFKKINGQTILVPANKHYPMLKPENSLIIWGIVVSVIRKYH